MPGCKARTTPGEKAELAPAEKAELAPAEKAELAPTVALVGYSVLVLLDGEWCPYRVIGWTEAHGHAMCYCGPSDEAPVLEHYDSLLSAEVRDPTTSQPFPGGLHPKARDDEHKLAEKVFRRANEIMEKYGLSLAEKAAKKLTIELPVSSQAICRCL